MFAPVSGDGVFSMAMSPRDAALVAVGFRSGLLCLVDASQGSVLHRVDAHDQELQSLTWYPTEERGAWLASSSRDKCIKIWRVCSENSEETERVDSAAGATRCTRAAATLAVDRVLRLPTGKQGQAYNPSKHLWLPVVWSTATSDQDTAELEKGTPKSTMRLWSGSFDGNLLMWNVPVREASTVKATRSSGSPPLRPVAVKNGHNRILFNIVALPSDVYALHQQQQQQQLPSLLTVSLDRELRLWTETRAAKTNGGAGAAPAVARTVSKLLGLGGHVYCAAYNDRTSTVALACGDQTIRLWKLHSGKGGGLYDTELLWKGLKSKVTSVAWHPLASSVLAFGTEDGTLGMYDTQSKKQTRFRSSHVGDVQQLEWRLDAGASATEDGGAEADGGANAFLDAMHELEKAQAEGASLDDALVELEASKRRPQAESPQLRVVLWSRDALGQLLESDAEHPDAPSHVISAARSCSSFAWSEDEDANGTVAIGNPNGSVKLVDQSLMRRTTHDTDAAHSGKIVHDHNERVGSVAWSTRDGIRLLATGSDDGKIFVYRFDSDALTLIAQLTGHSGKITRLQWQPPPLDVASEHSASGGDGALPLLASCAADGSARVWDVLDRERHPVARFYDHIGRVLALDWVSGSVLVTGGEDQTARVWDLVSFPAHVDAESDAGDMISPTVSTPRAKAASSKQPRPKPTARETKTDAGAVKEANGVVHDSLSTPTSGPKKQNKKKVKAKSTALFHTQAAPTPSGEVVRLLAQRLRRPLDASTAGGVGEIGASSEDSDAFMPALLQLVDRNSGSAAAGPRRAMAAFAVAEQARFASEGDWEGRARVLLLGGQIADALRVVAKEGALDATWLALAPMAGTNVWREMTNLFARQLEAQGDHAQAALHLLSIGKVRAAACALVGGSAFREALALIRLRLGPSDPLVSETTWKYAEWLEARGNYGDAALVYLSMEHARGVAPAAGASEVTSWRWRAVCALVKTRSAACIAQAVELLHEAASAGAASAGAAEELAFPATFLTVDVIGVLVCEGRLAVAERAADLLLLSSPLVRVHSSLPMAKTAFRLTRCLLGVLSAMERYRLRADAAPAAASTERKTLADWQRQCPNNEAVQLLLALVNDSSGDGSESESYPPCLVATSPATLVTRADAFWSDVLDVCRLCGIWSAEDDAEDGYPDGSSTLEEAQELLMDDEASWLLLEWRDAMDAADSLSPSARHVDAAIDVMRLAVDAAARCLVSAMEHLVRLLADVVDCSNDEDGKVDDHIVPLAAMELVTLVFPAGIASATPSSVLAVGELTEELADARSLWRTSRLLQCRALVARCSRGSITGDARKWVVDAVRNVHEEDANGVQDDEDARSHREALKKEVDALESLSL